MLVRWYCLPSRLFPICKERDTETDKQNRQTKQTDKTDRQDRQTRQDKRHRDKTNRRRQTDKNKELDC